MNETITHNDDGIKPIETVLFTIEKEVPQLITKTIKSAKSDVEIRKKNVARETALLQEAQALLTKLQNEASNLPER